MSLAGLRLSVAGDHLGAMAKALMPPIPLYGPAALARMSLENSAHAFWLMDPTLSLDERIDRSLRQRLKSAQEEQAVARLLLTVKWKDTGIEEAIVKEAVDLGLAELKGLPSATELVGALLEGHVKRPNAGRGVYKYLSALSHGTTYAALQRYRPSGSGDNPFTQRSDPVVSIDSVVWTVWVTIAGHAAAADRAINYCGLDRSAWEQHLGTIGVRILPTSL